MSFVRFYVDSDNKPICKIHLLFKLGTVVAYRNVFLRSLRCVLFFCNTLGRVDRAAGADSAAVTGGERRSVFGTTL